MTSPLKNPPNPPYSLITLLLSSILSYIAIMDLLLLEKTLMGLFIAVVVAVVISKLRGKKFKLPPGPIPVPVFGNWLQVGDDLNHRNLTDMAKRFGDVFMLRMGQRNLVVVSSPDLAKEVLHTQGVEFGSRTRNVVFDIFTGKGQVPNLMLR